MNTKHRIRVLQQKVQEQILNDCLVPVSLLETRDRYRDEKMSFSTSMTLKSCGQMKRQTDKCSAHQVAIAGKEGAEMLMAIQCKVHQGEGTVRVVGNSGRHTFCSCLLQVSDSK